MTIRRAPLFDDIMHFAPGGRAWWQNTADGVRIRTACWRKGSKGSVVLLNGRTEYIEKFGIAARELNDRGFGFATLDWRGQGLSDSAPGPPGLGHVDDFFEYQLDLEAARTAFERAGLPRPWFLIAHSMGGAIGLRALAENRPQFKAAVFLGPLWGLALPRSTLMVARAISGLSVRVGCSKRFVVGTGPRTHIRISSFKLNRLTSDRQMFEFMHGQLQLRPELLCGGPSYGWLHAVFLEMGRLQRLPVPKVPGLIIFGSDERIVDSRSIEAMCSRWPGFDLLKIAGSRHELLMETAATRRIVLDRATALFSRCR